MLGLGLGIHRTINFVSSIWTPAQIITSLWLDADDEPTVISSLGKVSSWLDKSGNLNHAVQVTSTKQPSFANSRLTFDGTDDCLRIADSSSLEITEGLNISVVMKVVTDAGYVLSRTGSSGSSMQYGLSQAGGVEEVDFYLNAGVRDSSISTKNVDHIVSSNWDKINAEVFVDGSSDGSSPYSISLVNQINTFIGCRSNSADGSTQAIHYEGEIAEIILTPNSLSLSDRQKLEGYLAWKWSGGI